MKARNHRLSIAWRAAVQLICTLASRLGIYLHPATLSTITKVIRQKFSD
ncbi:MAG TPA: hypothetical protein VMR75_01680 [Candidatus Saccharimonadales bacterium]|nr:hypothetical protein [Candidatus Saccharimonadales bacterium]